MKEYAMTHMEKAVERDEWERGCDPDSSRLVCWAGDEIKATTLPVLLKKIATRYGLSDEDMASASVLDHIYGDSEQTTAISLNRQECDGGSAPTPGEIEEWKAGRKSLWLADYTFCLVVREVSGVPLEDLLAAGVHIPEVASEGSL